VTMAAAVLPCTVNDGPLLRVGQTPTWISPGLSCQMHAAYMCISYELARHCCHALVAVLLHFLLCHRGMVHGVVAWLLRPQLNSPVHATSTEYLYPPGLCWVCGPQMPGDNHCGWTDITSSICSTICLEHSCTLKLILAPFLATMCLTATSSAPPSGPKR